MCRFLPPLMCLVNNSNIRTKCWRDIIYALSGSLKKLPSPLRLDPVVFYALVQMTMGCRGGHPFSLARVGQAHVANSYLSIWSTGCYIIHSVTQRDIDTTDKRRCASTRACAVCSSRAGGGGFGDRNLDEPRAASMSRRPHAVFDYRLNIFIFVFFFFFLLYLFRVKSSTAIRHMSAFFRGRVNLCGGCFRYCYSVEFNKLWAFE